ncbi:MAG: glycosyltransferase [Cyclobacteriaceae bacterium]|nr:glycosyltransferase [Cyclobacteriaceae bacterium]
MIAFFTVVMTTYFSLLLLLIYGWNKLAPMGKRNGEQTVISVVVAFRNEANQIHHLIRSLADLNYPADRFEVILVNDHSDDNSENVVKSLIHDKSNFSHIHLDDDKLGKKNAITKGVNLAKGELIVTTDADCVVQPNWLHTINASFENDAIQMAFGGVSLKGTSFFSTLQAIEFSSLIGSGAATLGLGLFTMCNGANLAFRKKSFEAVSGYEGNLEIPSGDDEFLARKILTRFPSSIIFMRDKEAVVMSRPAGTLKVFVHQRLRWAGKWKYNSSWLSKLLAVQILLVQLVFMGLILMAFLHIDAIGLIVSLIAAKILLEILVIYPVARFLAISWSWIAFFLLQLIYPLYVIAIGIMSQGMSYQWKGRSLSHKM